MRGFPQPSGLICLLSSAFSPYDRAVRGGTVLCNCPSWFSAATRAGCCAAEHPLAANGRRCLAHVSASPTVGRAVPNDQGAPRGNRCILYATAINACHYSPAAVSMTTLAFTSAVILFLSVVHCAAVRPKALRTCVSLKRPFVIHSRIRLAIGTSSSFLPSR